MTPEEYNSQATNDQSTTMWLLGWLQGMVMTSETGIVTQAVATDYDPDNVPVGFTVTTASGLHLRVTVEASR